MNEATMDTEIEISRTDILEIEIKEVSTVIDKEAVEDMEVIDKEAEEVMVEIDEVAAEDLEVIDKEAEADMEITEITMKTAIKSYNVE